MSDISSLSNQKIAGQLPIKTRIQQSFSAYPLWWFLGVVFVLRALFILISPLDLIADESYYWDWSRRLDYGYYSKPPMIAWINWVSSSIFGANEFAVRFPATLFGTLGLISVFQLGAKLFAFRVGLFAVILLAVTPGHTAMSFLMTIDSPFLFFWMAALYSFWMATSSEKPSMLWCGITVLWLGLGMLSKQTMLAFFPLAGLFLLVTPSRRHLCLSPRLWGTALLGLMFLLPVIYWNSQHDWITFAHTASHFQETSVSFVTMIKRFIDFILGQIGVVSPVLWFAVMASLVAAFRQFSKLSDAERYLFCFSGVPLAGIILLSATRRLEPNWPAAFYPAGVVLATAVLLGRSTLTDLFKDRTRMLKWSWQTGLCFSLATYAAILIVPFSPLAGSSLDFTARLRGWKQLAIRLDELKNKQVRLNNSQKPLIISTAGRDITSALAFYLPDQPLVPFWSQDDAGVQCQYDLWERPDLSQHSEAIVVTEVDPVLPHSLNNSYARWDSLGVISVDLGRGRTREYEIFRAHSRPETETSSSPLPLAKESESHLTKFK